MLPELPDLKFTGRGNFFLLAGPCVVEGEKITLHIAETVAGICDRLKIPFIFKASYKKANRSKLDSFTGIGDQKGLEILALVREKFKIPVVTDVHTAEEAALASKYADVLQIPAFLARQTELLIAAGKTGRAVNIKKGQFMAPGAMRLAAEKVLSTGNERIMLTERGTMFGYQDLIVDYRGIPEMRASGYPVILDVTHSLQQPNQEAGVTGGRPDMIETIAKAGIAVGVDGLFLETHPDPANAKSDGANMIRLDLLEKMLQNLITLRSAVNKMH
jgi:2-dehydro-3-deoxyphosphooctonate aldolase (KDO 8-P synthase)